MNQPPTTAGWRLSPAEFALTLEGNGRDRIPYPLRRRPEFAESLEVLGERRRATALRIREIYDQDLHRVFEVLLEPRVRVEIEGFTGPGQTEAVRIYAGISGAEATLAVQAPGATREDGGDITLTRLPASAVAAQIVATLPQVVGGGLPRFEGRRTDLDAPVYARNPTRLSPIEQLQKFFRRPRSGTGEITVYPGFALDARPTDDGSAFLWLDYPDDGRYLMQYHDADSFTVIPGPPAEITRRLQTRIDTMARRADHAGAS